MAFDGIVTRAMVRELNQEILGGRITKIYQHERDSIVLQIFISGKKKRLFCSASGNASRVYITDETFENPDSPSPFCMLMRKYFSGGIITEIRQEGAERIITICVSTYDEMNFEVQRKIIVEIMGKHSNIILVNGDGKILDSVKRVSISTSRVRQILPGMQYTLPPSQNKIPFYDVNLRDFESIDKTQKDMLSNIGGISPSVASELAESENPASYLDSELDRLDSGQSVPRAFKDEFGKYRDYHIINMPRMSYACKEESFNTLSECIYKFFSSKELVGQLNQKKRQLISRVSEKLDKCYLKLQRLKEDLQIAEDSDHLRLYAELITANLHSIKQGGETANLYNYYTGENIDVPMDIRYSPAKNAQNYFKKFGKYKTAVHEKKIQIRETESEIAYLESTINFIESCNSLHEVESIKSELMETGYIRRRNIKKSVKREKPKPIEYKSPTGRMIFVGRNNKENDWLTLKFASKTDLWFHTKDIPGSHVILKTSGLNLDDIDKKDIMFAASIAAKHSKGSESENVPVDYVTVRHVKKPSGSKPGMVIFTDNKTVWINPAK